MIEGDSFVYSSGGLTVTSLGIDSFFCTCGSFIDDYLRLLEDDHKQYTYSILARLAVEFVLQLRVIRVERNSNNDAVCELVPLVLLKH